MRAQQLTDDVGFFARAGRADGNIDRTMQAGLGITGKKWGSPDDTFGIVGIVKASTALTPRGSMPAAAASSSATDNCPIRGRKRS
jgi:hypothetical protein